MSKGLRLLQRKARLCLAGCVLRFSDLCCQIGVFLLFTSLSPTYPPPCHWVHSARNLRKALLWGHRSPSPLIPRFLWRITLDRNPDSFSNKVGWHSMHTYRVNVLLGPFSLFFFPLLCHYLATIFSFPTLGYVAQVSPVIHLSAHQVGS